MMNYSEMTEEPPRGNLDFIRLHPILQTLVGGTVSVDGALGMITDVTALRHVHVLMDDGTKRRLSVHDGIQSLFNVLSTTSDRAAFQLVKQMAVHLAHAMKQYKSELSMVRNQRAALGKRRRYREQRISSLKSTLAALQESGESLEHDPERRDSNSTERTTPEMMEMTEREIQNVEHQREDLDQEHRELVKRLSALSKKAPYFFTSQRAIVQFFNARGPRRVSLSALKRWTSGQCLGLPGTRCAFDEESEAMLVRAILTRDALGMPMGREDILSVAREMAADGCRFGPHGPTKSWFKGFLKRAKERDPTIICALVRGMDFRTLKWLNRDNINWWFDAFNRIVREKRFAREPEPGEVGESIWLPGMLHRVVCSDETCISGAHTRKASNPPIKAFTSADRVDTENSSTGRRRVARAAHVTEEHITLLASVTLAGSVAPPAYALAASRDIRPAIRKAIEDAAAKCGGPRIEQDLPAFNGRDINEAFLAVSESGSVTTDNITPLMTSLFRAMYPDLADEDGKRIIWLTDWHGSRLSSHFLDSMNSLGVVMLGLIPNTTSKTQLADVSLFGPFKCVLEKCQTKWIRENAGKKVDRVVKVTLSSIAMQQTFTRSRILKGAQATGMNPIDRNRLLQDASVRDGDVLRAAFEASKDRWLLNVVQATQEGPLALESPRADELLGASSAGPSALPGTPTTPLRREQAQKTYETLSRGAGLIRRRGRGADMSPGYTIESLIDELQEFLCTLKRDGESRIAKKRRETQDELDAVLLRVTELQRDATCVKSKILQEISLIETLLEKAIEGQLDLAECQNISKLLHRLQNIPRDAYGLPHDTSATPDVDVVQAQRGVGSRAEIINELVADAVHRVQGSVERPGTRPSDRTHSGKLPFRVGNLIEVTGEIEGTSSPFRALVREHDDHKRAAAEEKLAKASAKKAADYAVLRDLPHRVEALALRINAMPASNRVGDCREYLKAALALAQASGEKSQEGILQGILSMKGTELKAAVAALVHPPP